MNNEPQLFNAPAAPKQDENSVSEPSPTPPSRPFFGQEDFRPFYLLAKEEPQHRVMCVLAAQGFTTTEIAEQTGYTVPTVAYVKKQPWAQKLIAELIESNGSRAIKSVLQAAAVDAAKLLVDIVRDPTVKTEIRAKEANNLLSRLYGTAPQVVMHGKIDATEISDEELLATATGNVA